MKVFRWLLSLMCIGLCVAGCGAIINGKLVGGLIVIVWGIAGLLWTLSVSTRRTQTDDFIDKYVG